MYRSLATAPAMFWIQFGLLLVLGFRSDVHAVEPSDGADAAAVAVIEELGGSIGAIANNSKDLRVDFHLGGEELTDDGLVHVAALKNVTSLNLKGTKITNAGLVHLHGLTTLRRLHEMNLDKP